MRIELISPFQVNGEQCPGIEGEEWKFMNPNQSISYFWHF
jgi:hypothetical protein